MKLVGLASIVLICAGPLIAEGFRGLEWGSGQDAVIEIEGDDYAFQGERIIVYEREMLDITVSAKFGFEDGRLRAGYYDFPSDMEHRVVMALYEKFGATDDAGRFGMKTWELGETDVSTIRDADRFIVAYYDAKHMDEVLAAEERAREQQEKEDAKAF